jgi:hypothetical protein
MSEGAAKLFIRLAGLYNKWLAGHAAIKKD